jgi:hypothetical protein
MRERAKDAMGNTLVPIAGIVGSEITQIKDALEALTKSVTVSGCPHTVTEVQVQIGSFLCSHSHALHTAARAARAPHAQRSRSQSQRRPMMPPPPPRLFGSEKQRHPAHTHDPD